MYRLIDSLTPIKVSPYVYPGLAMAQGDANIARLVYDVCTELNEDMNEVCSPRRQRHLVNIRFAIYHCLILRDHRTYKAVGDHFNRDHSSVVAGVKTWSHLLEVKDKEAWRLQRIVNQSYHNQITQDTHVPEKKIF